MKTDRQLLSSPGFIISVAILLLNDFLLKAAFGNWITGKLSDFAGLFAFALFWTALFPARRPLIVSITAIVFAWWKSAYSQPFIDGWNALPLPDLDRVVDLTDLLALVVLLPAYLYAHAEKRFSRIHPVFPALIGAFAFAATSKSAPTMTIHKEYHFPFSKDTLEARLEQLYRQNGYNGSFSDKDTSFVRITYPTDFCGYTQAVGEAWQQPDSTAVLHISTIDYWCDTTGWNRYKLKEEFEKVVIKKLHENESSP